MQPHDCPTHAPARTRVQDLGFAILWTSAKWQRWDKTNCRDLRLCEIFRGSRLEAPQPHIEVGSNEKMSPRLMICMFVFVWRMLILGLITSYHSVPSRRVLPSQVLSLSLPSPPQRSHSRVTFQRGSSPCIPMSLSSSTPPETPLRSSPGLVGVNFREQFLEFRHDPLIINSSEKAPSVVVIVVVIIIIIIIIIIISLANQSGV